MLKNDSLKNKIYYQASQPNQAKPSQAKPSQSQAKPSQTNQIGQTKPENHRSMSEKTEEIVREKLRALGYKDQDNGINHRRTKI